MLFGSESKCNRELFCSTYLQGLTFPAELVNGWVLEQVAAEPEIERVRQSIDMVMKSEEGDELTMYVARTVEGSECFARTRYLDISYYGDYQDAEPESVIDLLNHVTQKLADAEADGLEEETIEKIFGPAPSAPLSVGSLYDEEAEGDSGSPSEGEGTADKPEDDSGNKLLGMLESHDEEGGDA
jgi:TATA-binding protein-associated factor Taf7